MPPPRDDDEQKKHEQKKPKPRRLFSFDSIKSNNSSELETTKHFRSPLNPFELSNGQEGDIETNLLAGDHSGQVTLVDEPASISPSITGSPHAGHSQSGTRLEWVTPSSISSRSSTPDNAPSAPSSTTRARWEHLRQHVLPGLVRPSSPLPKKTPSQASLHKPSPSSSTPRPSGLSRLGFSQVVEYARDVSDDERNFGKEILKACAAARYAEVSRSPRDRDGQSSTISFSGTVTSASTGRKIDYFPQSIVSLTSTSGSTTTPSLKLLYQVLISCPPVEMGQRHLPHERHVLGTLLCPFLSPSKYSITKEVEEKTIAVEAFESILKIWPPIDESASVERCLWCTKAAAAIGPSAIRTRILSSLWPLLVPGDENKISLTTLGFKSVTGGLLILVATLLSGSTSVSQVLYQDTQLLKDLILKFLSGSFGDLDETHIEEVYGIEYGIEDRKNVGALRRGVFLEGLVGCIENCTRTGTGVWLLENLLEEYWALPSTDRLTPLQAIICSRKLSTCCRFSSIMLQPFFLSPSTMPLFSSPMSSPSVPSLSSSSPSGPSTPSYPATNPKLPLLIVALLQKRVIPEAEALSSTGNKDDIAVLGARQGVVRVVLLVLCLGLDSSEGIEVVGSPTQSGDFFCGFSSSTVHGRADMVKWASGLLYQWYKAGDDLPWRTVLEKTLPQVIKEGWDTAIRVLTALLKYIPEEVRKSVFTSIFPILNDQLVENPPPYPFLSLTSLLTDLSRIYPLLFFKPLIACATSDQESMVVNHLCILQVHTKYVQDYWVREVEMMCVALLKNPGGKADETTGQWGVARLGQSVLLVELIGNVQNARRAKEAAANTLDPAFLGVIRFVTTLEKRLSILIEEKEKTTPIPPSQRTLFCILFREIRLLTRSLKAAPWLSRTLSWFHMFWMNDENDELEQEVSDSMQRIQGLYAVAQEGVQQNEKRRSSMFSMTTFRTTLGDPNSDEKKPLDLPSTFVEHRKLIESLSKGYLPKAMKLFVSLSAIIPQEDYQVLGPLLWEYCLESNVGSSSTASACFLLMQCAEKAPLDLLAAIEVDLQTSDDTTRLGAVRKVSILINWRFQIVSQNILTDRTHRPFKLARAPLPFIATDLGTNLYVHVDEPNENRDGEDVPLELKKRLAELGWVEEGAGVVDQRQMWIRTPISLLSASQLDCLAGGSGDYEALSPTPSPNPSPKKWMDQQMQLQAEEAAALLRRNSSSGGPMNIVKRRAVFVPSLTVIFRRLATLVYDPNFAVASAARMTLLDLMRNDPGILTRPAFDLFVGEHKDIQSAISTFSAFLHTRSVLPPALTHHIFNNMAGFLKMAARDVEMSSALHDFGQSIRILTSMATQVSDMSVREIRRSKIDPLMIPSGSLWYSSSAPTGPMFPRNFETSDNPFGPALQNLISITMVRVSQNMFFLSMLKRNYQDVQVVRKTLSMLVLPSLEADEVQKALEIQDFIPRKHISSDQPSSRNSTVDDLSLMLARSYILLVAQIFRSMSRHLSDRDELGVLVDGLNRTLLVHGDDINIVSQVLIALMVASTRFQRLFTSGGGYTLFIPALVKLYVEAPSHPGIRAAIEYATSRFYALHKESFLFQSIDTIGQIALLPDIDTDWFSEGVYNMFYSLRGSTASAVDIAGIRDANKAQERQALMIHTANEAPQTLMETILRVDSKTGHQISLQLPDEYETTRLHMDDFVRLFLTVIAHEPTIARARHFLRLLRFLVPHLYNCSSSTRSVLAEGIPALGQILTKSFAKPKGGEGSFIEKTRLPTDANQLGLDYLHIVLAFATVGQLSLGVARQALDLLKGLLKDWPENNLDTLSTFLSSFVQMLLLREDSPSPKYVATFLQDLSPILYTYKIGVDFTGVLKTILKLSEMPVYANNSMFSHVVVSEICAARLEAWELAASKNQLVNMQCHPTLISLLGEAIFLTEADIIDELEKRAPTCQFLAGVIFPLVLTMKTDSQLIIDGLRTDGHRKVLVSAWVRLLHYAMSACQTSRKDNEEIQRSRLGIGGSFRSKPSSQEGSDGVFWRSRIPTFMTALQVIKVVVIRGSDEISLPRLGIWDRLGGFLRTMLAEGSAEFAFWHGSSSTTTTPAGSPRSSSLFGLSNSGSMSTTDLPPPISPSIKSKRPFSLPRPRMIDYSLWSMLEFIFSYRNPLRLQLKLLMMEKLIALDLELQNQEGKNTSMSSFPTSPSGTPMSVFSKPRKHISGLIVPSPESSPRLMPSLSNLSSSMPSMLEIPTGRQAGYQTFPSPRERPPGLPKIVHLGPALSSSSPILSMGAELAEGHGRLGNAEVKTMRIKSPDLILATFRRIRGVQVFMGYNLLLLLPGMSRNEVPNDGDVALQAWTKQQALGAIQTETATLLEELEECFGLDNDTVVEQVAEYTSSI